MRRWLRGERTRARRPPAASEYGARAISSVPWLAAIHAAALLLAADVARAATHLYDFHDVLPAAARLERATPALAGQGATVAPGLPRFVAEAVSPGARIVAAIPSTQRILAVRSVAGVEHTIVRIGNLPSLTEGTPGAVPEPGYRQPHATLRALYGSGAPWGLPHSAEILADGTVLIHTGSAGSELRSATILTSLAGFEAPAGHELVRLGSYPSASAAESTYAPAFFTRTTWLPNLGIEVSAVVEYASDGLVSGVDPADGRALGYASTDGGRTWVRVIDTDDPRLGRDLVDGAKHLHHLEPFEWRDPDDGQWKVGVVALLGDGPAAAGQIVVRARGATFVDPDVGPEPLLHRLKAVGRHQLTDLLPLNPSEMEGVSLLHLQGADGGSSQQAGMARIRISGAGEQDEITFQSTVSFTSLYGAPSRLNTVPFVFQLGELGHGELVAPTWWFGSRGVWISPDRGTSWTNAYLAAHEGFRGATPTGVDGFWTLSSGSNASTLFRVGPALLRRSLRLGPAAREVRSLPVFSAVASDVTGAVPGPRELPADVPVTRLHSTTLRNGESFASGLAQPITAEPGEFVHLVYWLKPGRPDVSLSGFETSLELALADGGRTGGGVHEVALGLDDWVRVVVTEQVPPGGPAATSAVPGFVLAENALADRPLDYFATSPQIVVSRQPGVQAVRSGQETAADRLTLTLPPLASQWTVAIWGTEALHFVASLVDAGGTWVGVEPTRIGSVEGATGMASSLSLVAPSGSWGRTAGQRIFFPTQDLVVVTREADDRIRLYVARGMGELEALTAPAGSGFTPRELRFGSADWQRVFEGSVHRVRVWDDVALSAAEIESERTRYEVSGRSACGVGAELALALAALRCARRPRRARVSAEAPAATPPAASSGAAGARARARS